MSKLFLFIFSVSYLLTGCGSSDTESSEKLPKFTTKEGSELSISEALCGNINVSLDPDYNQFSDYIELHNNTSKKILLNGLFISDDAKNLDKWKFPDGLTIEANGYILVWADGKDKKKKVAHTNFKLSQKKGTIIVSDTAGNIYDYINYEGIKSNVSIKRDGDSMVYMSPTPNALNSKTHRSQELVKVKNLEHIDITSQQYFVNNLLPIVSISIDPAYLDNDYIGIYTVGKNGKVYTGCNKDDNMPKNYMQKWKRPAYFDYYDKDKNRLISTGMDISISGQCSRNLDKKSFSFKLSKKYGSKSIENYFYSKSIEKIKDFKLRSNEEGGYINDVVAAAIVKNGELDVDYQDYKAVEVFINSEYWGVYNIREKKSDDFIKSNYPDVKRGKLDIIKKGNEAKEGDMNDYKALQNYLASKNFNLVDSDSYNHVSSQVDIDSFIDYMAIMIYSANDDWLAANHRCWKEKIEGGKWRWMLDDLDMGFMKWRIDPKPNLFEVAKGNDLSENSGLLLTQLFRSLLKNATFKDKFKSRFNNLLNGVFAPQNMISIANQLHGVRKDAYQREHKWIHNSYEIYTFDSNVQNELKPFLLQRSDIVKRDLNAL